MQSWYAARDSTTGEIIDWSDKTLPEECNEEIQLGQGKVRPDDAIRHRRNIVGWWLLREFGGYWIHHDILMLSKLRDLPFPVTASHGPVRCTAFMAFPKGHSVPIQALEIIRQAPLSDELYAPEVSGELMLTKIAGGVPELLFPLTKQGRRVKGADPWAVRVQWPGGNRWGTS